MKTCSRTHTHTRANRTTQNNFLATLCNQKLLGKRPMSYSPAVGQQRVHLEGLPLTYYNLMQILEFFGTNLSIYFSDDFCLLLPPLVHKCSVEDIYTCCSFKQGLLNAAVVLFNQNHHHNQKHFRTFPWMKDLIQYFSFYTTNRPST